QGLARRQSRARATAACGGRGREGEPFAARLRCGDGARHCAVPRRCAEAMMTSMRGRFVTFEGGEGSGKSTHAAILADRLNAGRIGVVRTREPGGSPGAEIIRHILLSGIAKPLGAETEAMLFAAARDDHVRSIIRPALLEGKWVICDRFIDSTRVYQGALGKVDEKLIRGLERVTVGPAM